MGVSSKSSLGRKDKGMLAVLILAAGDSTRFRAGDGTPKQFIEFPVEGEIRPMWEHAYRSLNAHDFDLYLATHEKHKGFLDAFWDVEYKSISLHATRGQLDTLYRSLLQMPEDDDADEIVVLNCDAGFATNVLNAMVIHGRQRNAPMAVTFKVDKDEEKRWSFVDGHPTFNAAREKDYISPWAMAGAYYFPDRLKLKQAVALTIHAAEANENQPEPYISHLYQNLPGRKFNMEISREQFFDWGTAKAFDEHARR